MIRSRVVALVLSLGAWRVRGRARDGRDAEVRLATGADGRAAIRGREPRRRHGRCGRQRVSCPATSGPGSCACRWTDGAAADGRNLRGQRTARCASRRCFRSTPAVEYHVVVPAVSDSGLAKPSDARDLDGDGRPPGRRSRSDDDRLGGVSVRGSRAGQSAAALRALLCADGPQGRPRVHHAARREGRGRRRSVPAARRGVLERAIARATRSSSIPAGRSAASCRISRWAGRSSPGNATRWSCRASGIDGEGLPLREEYPQGIHGGDRRTSVRST